MNALDLKSLTSKVFPNIKLVSIKPFNTYFRGKECQKARKALIKAGLKGSSEEKLISKEWFSLVRQHNKLRVALNKKMHAREKIAVEKFFRENPHTFAGKLFGKLKNSGKPSFSRDEAQQYFEKHTEMSNATMFIHHHQTSSVLAYHLGCFLSAAQLKMS